jgi:hypothetical protein
MRRFTTSLLVAVTVVALANCAGTGAGKKRTLRVPGGTNIAPVGLVIDASYDDRFDDFVPGYKVINVAVINQSFDIVYLDPERDVWKLKFAGHGKSLRAIHDLRRADPVAWSAMPQKAKDIMGYPLFIPVGARQVIDIFVPDTVDAAKFTELDVYLKSLNTTLEVISRQ